MKYVSINSDGLPVAYYESEINVIPDGAFQITDEQWLDLISNPMARRWDGSTFANYTPPPTPPPPDPVPPSITRRQCALELHARGLIGGDEAVAMAATASPPAMMAGLFSALSEAEQVIARIDFAAAAYERGNHLLDGLMTASGASAADIDDFFRAAAAR